ncbi:carbonic anhydrase [Microbacterium sp. AG790]|uniref:carbonic anhydrase family protein n=1 Tax=Microbacterium sp. AG790 TaxID=2183995 RepID=UPI000EADBDEB|nr:carbonic anhydrase [Microbacterium sp. AG790]
MISRLVRDLLSLGSAMAIVVVVAACTSTGAVVPPTPSQTSTMGTWSYEGSAGPDNWGEIAAACRDGEGSRESPIDIQLAKLLPATSAKTVMVNYGPTVFSAENTGHAVEAVPENLTADSVTADGTTYYLQQFHFHVSSEHTLDGSYSAAELHFVNKSVDGKVLVLGVLVQLGDASSALDEMLSKLPSSSASPDNVTALTKPIDPSVFLPSGSPSAQYEGSLTTPPCTEGVRWNVYLTPITISSSQLAELTSRYSANHRPTQPLHDRLVERVPAA